MTVSIEDQIRAVKRELSLRYNVYHRRVDSGVMTKDDADREIAVMQGVLRTLAAVAANDIETLREFSANRLF